MLALSFDDGTEASLPAELLRVESPSAEVQGHGPGQRVLVTGKRRVAITGVEPVGNYAVRLVFSDGHDSGIYSWEFLYQLGREQNIRWRRYLRLLEDAGLTRE
jgi:DUF971 family protein